MKIKEILPKLSKKSLLALVLAVAILLSTVITVPLLSKGDPDADPSSSEPPSSSTVSATTSGSIADLLLKDTTLGENAIDTDDVTQLQNAVKTLTKRIAEDPENDELYVQRAAFYYYLEQYEKALADYTKALSLKETAQTYYYRASVYVAMGENQKAYDDLKLALADSPDKTDYLSLFADVCNSLKKYRESLQTLQKLIDKDQKNAILYALAGDASVYLSDHTSAVTYYRGALQNFSQKTETAGISKVSLYSACGNSLKTLEKFSEAVTAYENAIQLSPQKEFYFQRGFCLLQSGQYEAAIPDFTACVDKNYEVPIAKFQRGLCYFSLGKYETAIEDFGAYETAYPTKTDTYLYMGLCYQSLKDYPTAISYYEKSIAANISVGDCSFNMGNCLYNQEKYADAIPHYTKAIELNAQLYPALLNRGVAHIKTNKYNEAKEDLKRVIDECKETSLVEAATKSYDPIKNITIITKK